MNMSYFILDVTKYRAYWCDKPYNERLAVEDYFYFRVIGDKKIGFYEVCEHNKTSTIQIRSHIKFLVDEKIIREPEFGETHTRIK